VARVTVCHRDELYGVSKGGELRSRSAELKFAIIRMRPDAENSEPKIWHAKQCSNESGQVSSSKRLYRRSIHRPNVFILSSLRIV
jgi:hypothetical protein